MSMANKNDIYEQAIASILAHREASLRASVSICAERTDSPIEGAFYLAFASAIAESAYCLDIQFELQRKVGNYRVDFYAELNGQKLIIECDGHDFHDRTKGQDGIPGSVPTLIAQGYRVIRFTGSEIWKDAYACANQAVAMLEELFHAHEHAIHTAMERPE